MWFTTGADPEKWTGWWFQVINQYFAHYCPNVARNSRNFPLRGLSIRHCMERFLYIFNLFRFFFFKKKKENKQRNTQKKMINYCVKALETLAGNRHGFPWIHVIQLSMERTTAGKLFDICLVDRSSANKWNQCNLEITRDNINTAYLLIEYQNTC